MPGIQEHNTPGPQARRYGIIHPLWMSFYAGEIYRDVARNWGGITYVYLFFLLAICWIPEMAVVHEEIGLYIERVMPKYLDQIPEITITDGKVSVTGSTPVYVRDPETDTVAFIIDTSGQHTSLRDTDAAALLTETQLFVRNSPGAGTQTFDLPPGEHMVITREVLEQWMLALKSSLSILLYPFAVLISFLYRTGQTLLYAGIGLIYIQNFNANMSYSTLVRITVIAVTPAVILDTAHNLLGATMPFWTGICFIVAMCYLYFGVKVNLIDQNGDQTNQITTV